MTVILFIDTFLIFSTHFHLRFSRKYVSVIPNYMNVNNVQMPQEEKELEAIDIYLFTNGEESMPPRKYHIHKQQLYMWDDTRSYLAQSHYGTPFSTIDVFTLDGVRINDPLFLKDGFTYVGVLAEDRFKPAKYEDYILRASRSLEKRIEKLMASEIKLQDSNRIDYEIELTKEHTSSNYKLQTLDICKNEVGGSMTSEKVKIFEKKISCSKPTLKSTWKTLGMANSKWSENRSLKDNQQKRTNVRKPLQTFGAGLGTEPKRTAFNKFDSNKKGNKQNINTNKEITGNKPNTLIIATIPSKHNDNENKTKTPVSTAIEHLYKEGLDPTINLAEREIDDISYTTNTDLSDYVTEATAQKRVTTNKETISLQKDDLRNFVKKVFEESVKSKTTVVKINDVAVGNSSLHTVVAVLDNNNHTKNIAHRDEKYSTNINKGEILNLKVSIQLHDKESPTVKENGNSKPNITKDITFDKVSQTDADVIWNDEILKKNQEETGFCVKTISLQSLFNPKNTSSKNDISPPAEGINNNVLLVQTLCSPLQKKELHNNKTSVLQTEPNFMYNANRDFVILTAYNEPKKNACFSCVSRTSSETEQPRTPIIKQVCNTCKDLNKQEECKKFYVSRPCAEIEGQKVEYFIRKKESVSSMISDENKGKEYVVCKRMACEICPKTVVDSFVQTDVSKTVFEVRPHRDGHYTFHLPPLCFIKHHNL